MTQKEYENIRKDFMLKIKIMDTSIKGIADSEEYAKATEYNKGIMDCVHALEKYLN